MYMLIISCFTAGVLAVIAYNGQCTQQYLAEIKNELVKLRHVLEKRK